MLVKTAGVPKQTPRTPGPDDWAAERIQYERKERGWSTAELARRVTAAGCKINQSSVWHIENGEPRRKVSAGEAVAFAKVFGLTLDRLIRPPDDPEKLVADLASLHSDLQAWQLEGRDLLRRHRDVWARKNALADQLRDHPLGPAVRDMYEEIVNLTEPGTFSQVLDDPDED